MRFETRLIALCGACVVAGFMLAIALWGGATAAVGVDEPITTTVAIDRTVDGFDVDHWRAQSRSFGRLAHGRLLRLRVVEHSMRWRRTIGEALNLACAIYSHCAELWRKARCESVNFTDFYNDTSHATGILQFLSSTWRSTPFRHFSMMSPYASALAGGWMHTHKRGGEWVCQ